MATFGTWSSGDVLTAADLNDGLPSCVVSNAGVTVASGSGFYVPFTSEQYDPYSWHDNSTNNTRITPTIAGWYLCTATINDLNPSGGNYRVLGIIQRNRGSGIMDTKFANADWNNYGPDDFSIAGYTYLNGTTDYVELLVLQVSGSNKTGQFVFGITRIAD